MLFFRGSSSRVYLVGIMWLRLMILMNGLTLDLLRVLFFDIRFVTLEGYRSIPTTRAWPKLWDLVPSSCTVRVKDAVVSITGGWKTFNYHHLLTLYSYKELAAVYIANISVSTLFPSKRKRDVRHIFLSWWWPHARSLWLWNTIRSAVHILITQRFVRLTLHLLKMFSDVVWGGVLLCV